MKDGSETPSSPEPHDAETLATPTLASPPAATWKLTQSSLGCNPTVSVSADDALDAASRLHQLGDWNEAIQAYQQIKARWPEHATSTANCIAQIQQKIDATAGG